MALVGLPKKTRAGKYNLLLRPEDDDLLERLKARLGLSTNAEVIRLALRALAQKEL